MPCRRLKSHVLHELYFVSQADFLGKLGYYLIGSLLPRQVPALSSAGRLIGRYCKAQFQAVDRHPGSDLENEALSELPTIRTLPS
jgi:hypothetical protein